MARSSLHSAQGSRNPPSLSECQTSHVVVEAAHEPHEVGVTVGGFDETVPDLDPRGEPDAKERPRRGSRGLGIGACV